MQRERERDQKKGKKEEEEEEEEKGKDNKVPQGRKDDVEGEEGGTRGGGIYER